MLRKVFFEISLAKNLTIFSVPAKLFGKTKCLTNNPFTAIPSLFKIKSPT